MMVNNLSKRLGTIRAYLELLSATMTPDSEDAMDEFDDPEMSYRRGFHQGAWILFEAIEPYLPPARAAVAREWIQKDVFGWRLKNMQGKSGREPSGEITAQIAPPTTRLAKL